jgi:hypothetical protein
MRPSITLPPGSAPPRVFLVVRARAAKAPRYYDTVVLANFAKNQAAQEISARDEG